MYTRLNGISVQCKINNSTGFPKVSIVVVKELNKEYFTTIKSFVYISVIIILNIRNQNLVNFR